MRYRASVEVDYAAGQAAPDDALRALASGIQQELSRMPGITVSRLAVQPRGAGVLVIEATLAGIDTGDLTNPLTALRLLDTAVDQALLRIGQFEEFDVARKRLAVTPERGGSS